MKEAGGACEAQFRDRQVQNMPRGGVCTEAHGAFVVHEENDNGGGVLEKLINKTTEPSAVMCYNCRVQAQYTVQFK